jgi:hypothetical protein
MTPHAKEVDTLILRHSRNMPAGTEWDDFAQSCSGSYHCSRGYIAAMRLTHEIHIFELFLGENKIGQSVVAKPYFRKSGSRVFLDTIQLCPTHEAHWPAAMKAILRTLGPGRYRYGSVLSVLAPPSDDDFRRIAGVTIQSTETYQVHTIIFSSWTNWETYYQALSTNAKRNAAKAIKSDPNIRVESFTGWHSLPYFLQILWMRRSMYLRKNTDLGVLAWMVRFIRRLVFLRRYISVVRVIYHGRHTAFACIVQFGRQAYYVDGASIRENGGSAWYLLTDVIRKSWDICPTGMFVMGFDGPGLRDQFAGWDNVLRQRQQCRVSQIPTSVVTFDYHC